jgi:ATP adenylyltransferase
MEHLFSPWRFKYVTEAQEEKGCELCRIAAVDSSKDESVFIIHRAEHHFLVLNIYPYTSGHLMIVPYEHRSRLADLSSEALIEFSSLAARVEKVLTEVYRPEGINMGMNLGQCAGAGIIEHLHMHAVPRWTGDTSFMTVVGATRVIPEDLHETWRKLRERLQDSTHGR